MEIREKRECKGLQQERACHLPRPCLVTPLLQVQGDYYGDLAARLGYFPSSIVREESTLKPGKIEVKTDVSVSGACRDLEGGSLGCDDGQRCPSPWLPAA